MNKFKLLLLGVLTCLLGVVLPTVAWAAEQASFTIGSREYSVDGKNKSMDVAPYIKNDRTFLPVRYAAIAMGIPEETGIIWDEQQRSVRLVAADREVTLHIGQTEMLVQVAKDAEPAKIIMDVSPELTDDRVMMPLRWIAEAFAVPVDWDAETRKVTLNAAPTGNEPTTLSSEPQKGIVTGSVVNIRSGPSTGYSILTTVNRGTVLTVISQADDWYQVTLDNGQTGWIASSLLDIRDVPNEISRGGSRPAVSGGLGTVTGMAQKLLGTKYVYGGTSPKGFDCSGFVQYLYKQVGITLPRTAKEQSAVGQKVAKDELQPGDLIFFATGKKGVIDHVGLYIGDRMMIHASTRSTGVIESDIDSDWYAERYVTARRIVK